MSGERIKIYSPKVPSAFFKRCDYPDFTGKTTKDLASYSVTLQAIIQRCQIQLQAIKTFLDNAAENPQSMPQVTLPKDDS